ncbi:hypothetical protein QQ056_06090 [Oscillatoria laete-virens NRMC-F 0139]|nr:hypothetical protein [Oscillatoria laete-virens]MDL5053114.1 hypothetical protein [Oscillatoria laete-virens NRMC-F 0139]
MINARFAFLLFILCLLHPAQALQINSDNSTYSRFSGGYPGSPTNNPTFFAADYDLSGVGWNNANSGQSFTVISPNHAVGATHFLPGVGATIRFLNADGALVSRTVSAQTQIAGTDLAMLTFSTSLTESDQVKINPVLFNPVLDEYLDMPLWMYGFTAKMGSSNTIDGFGNILIGGPSNTFAMVSYQNYTTPGQARGQVGDSGSPSFTPWDGQLALVGVHSAIGSVVVSPGVTNDATFDAFVPNYIAALNAAMGGTHRVSQITVLSSGNYNSPAGTELNDTVALYVTNGSGLLNNSAGTSGAGLFTTNDRKAVVTGTGSLWSNLPTLIVGDAHRSNSLHILNGGRVTATNLIVGATAASTNNLVVVNGASSRLIVTNAAGTGALDVRRGVLSLQGGEVRADTILATNSFSVISGFGSLVGNTIISSGGTISPGNSPGTIGGTDMVFGGGGNYLWEINDFNGTQGVDPGWDWMNLSGTLDITASAGNEFNINITSLTTFNTAGNAANFDEMQDYNLTILTAVGGITGFNASAFNLNMGAFSNAFTGSWAISQNGNNLVLNYTASVIPEPSTWTLLLFSAICSAVVFQRKLRKKGSQIRAAK